jgi:hypothetical protein
MTLPLQQRSIARALRVRYPQLTAEQREKITEEIIRQTAQAIQQGKQLAHIEKLPNGDVEISVFDVVENIVDQIQLSGE